MKTPRFYNSQRGSAFVAVLFIVTVLTVLGGIAVMQIMNHRATMNQAGAWQEALVAADAGVQQAIAQLELGLSQGISFCGTSGSTSVSGTTLTLTKNSSLLEGSATTTTSYTITRTLVTTSGTTTLPYYLVSSTGTVVIPISPGTVSSNAYDVVLRKFNFDFVAKSGTAIRVLNTWIKPRLNTSAALAANTSLAFSDHNITVDGFNSNDPTMSGTSGGLTGQPPTYAGQYDANGPYMANVATNGSLASIKNATVYGDALTNGGGATGTTNVKGETRNDYSQTFEPVPVPSWTTDSSQYTPGIYVQSGKKSVLDQSVTTSGTAYGGTVTSPARYVINSLKMNGAGDTTTFTFGTQGAIGSSSSDPTKSYIEIYVSGDVNTSGGGSTSLGAIYITPGVHVKFYVSGNVTITGNGIVNGGGLASNLSIYATGGSTQTVDLEGNPTFYGTVYAPDAAVTLKGSATYVGSIVGNTITANGDVTVYYDEALSNTGQIEGFALGTSLE
jgi:Tfp pilus assembly protein PilX